MIAKTILFSFVVILCSFFIAGGVFAKNKKDVSAVSDKGLAPAKTEALLEMKADIFSNAGTLDGMPSLSVAHSLSDSRYHLLNPSAEAFKVLSMMEKRVTDRKLIQKIKDKLPTLGENRLRMLAYLSEEVGVDDRSPKTDIAFLIATTLIIFS
jgi:hypothetical protein